ncbi:hypothetical protein PybrP1_005648 [[Pythium] brassicae (nom. inval.)]|nr:hypothetical protein PybrP1_005648 [[Pythium] brassicae (nom. inval.)]
MSMSQHFKKRKSRTSSAPPGVRRFPTLPSIASGSYALPGVVATGADAALSPTKSEWNALPAPPAAAHAASSESASLAAALTALQVSLKREFESFTPPTPAVSPVHRSAAKRARLDFPGVDECEPVPEMQGKVSPAPKARGALLAVSTRIKFELEKHLRKNSERSQRPRKRKQLSYFAIVGAFQQAARERDMSAAAAATSAVGGDERERR